MSPIDIDPLTGAPILVTLPPPIVDPSSDDFIAPGVTQDKPDNQGEATSVTRMMDAKNSTIESRIATQIREFKEQRGLKLQKIERVLVDGGMDTMSVMRTIQAIAFILDSES